MILFQCELLGDGQGGIEEHKTECLIPQSQIRSIMQMDSESFGINPCLRVECVDGSILFCRGVIDSIIGQLEYDDYKSELQTLLEAIDGIGMVLGKALYKMQEYRSEDMSRPVC